MMQRSSITIRRPILSKPLSSGYFPQIIPVPVLLVSLTLHGMELVLGQFRSAVPSLSLMPHASQTHYKLISYCYATKPQVSCTWQQASSVNTGIPPLQNTCFLLLKSSAQNFGLKSAPKLQDWVLTISLLLFPKPNFKRKDLRTISLRLIFGEKQPVFPDSALEGQKGRRDKLFRRAMKTSWYLFTVISSSFTYFIAFLPTFFLIGTGSYYTRSSLVLSSILQHQKIWRFEDYYKNLPKPIILETEVIIQGI